MKKIFIAADHGGVELKNSLIKTLQKLDLEIEDLGTDSDASVDYPDFAQELCKKVLACNNENPNQAGGILVCKSGIGMSISANRFPGINAGLVSDAETAGLTRRHNHTNVICLGASKTDAKTAGEIVESWLSAEPELGRHEDRVKKMDKITSCNQALDKVAKIDPDVFNAISAEEQRQKDNIELIASENFTSQAVMQAQGSVFTNKYAEGYPSKRWYGGCENCDEIENLAIERAKKLFDCEHVNVQPHSGSQANAAVYFSVLEHGDKILTMNLSHGGHLTHGHPANFSGKFFQVFQYGVDKETSRIDYDALEKQAEECQPKMITAGASAYPRIIDFKKMREIADKVGAYLFVDMAHIAGLVAGGVHPTPVPHAHFVTTTTHKSLRGPRGGLIMCQQKFAKKIDSAIFPFIQGGPLMHVISAKAVCLKEALDKNFANYQKQVVKNAQELAKSLEGFGFTIISGGTDNHLMLVDLRPKGLNGKIAQETLDEVAVTVNKNAIPFDTESPFKGGGIRIGTPAVTTRGMQEGEMRKIAEFITQALANVDKPSELKNIRQQVIEFNSNFPLYTASSKFL